MKLIKCPKCGWSVSNKRNGCPRCGAPLNNPEEKKPFTSNYRLFCEKCGSEVSMNHKFCKKCGAQLQKEKDTVPFFHFGPQGASIETVKVKELSDGRIQMGNKVFEPLFGPPNDPNAKPLKPFSMEDLNKIMEWEARSDLAARQGQFQEALEAIEKCLDVDPRAPMILFKKTLLLFQMKRYEHALETINQAMVYGSHIAEIWYARGLVLNNMGKIEEGLECFMNALKINPQFKPALDAKKKIETLKQDPTLKIDPELKKIIEQAIQFSQRGNIYQAFDILQDGLEKYPINVHLLTMQAELLIKTNRHEKALAVVEQGLFHNPNFKQLWLIKASIYGIMGKLSEAKKCLQKVIEIDPSDVLGWYDKGLVHLQLREIPKALECFDEALKFDPHNEKIIQQKRLALRAADLPPQEVAKKALDSFDKGITAFQQGELQKALDHLSTSIRIFPKFAENYLERAKVYQKLGDFEKAAVDYQEVLKVDPYSQEAKQGLEMCQMVNRLGGGFKGTWQSMMKMIDDFKAEEKRRFGENFNPNDMVHYLNHLKIPIRKTYQFIYQLIQKIKDESWISLRILKLSMNGFLEKDILKKYDFEFPIDKASENMPELMYRILLSEGNFIIYTGKVYSDDKKTLLFGDFRSLHDLAFLRSLDKNYETIKVYPLHDSVINSFELLKQNWEIIWHGTLLPPLYLFSNLHLLRNYLDSLLSEIQ